MANPIQFSRGDLVVHPRRPEWGEGTVDSAIDITQDGMPAQRLAVRFANRGLVTINTGVAPLVPKEAVPTMSSTTSGFSPARDSTFARAAGTLAPRGGDGWLGSLAPKPGDELVKLAEAMTDPFLSLAKRLEATLESYRFGNDPRQARALLDWAVAQTGLNDPLSKYTRHELEQAFSRWLRDRDNHLFELVKLGKKQGRTDVLHEVAASAKAPAARDALRRAIQK